MSDIKLRSYQETQLDFLKENNGVVKGLQSPTGTGKSIVLLSFIEQCIKEDKYDTIVLTTGFNELVFQMAKDSELFDFDVKVIIGSGHLVPNCKNKIAPDFEFSKKFQGACSNCDPEGQLRQKTGKNCSKSCIMNFLRKKKKVIITNHSYFLAMKNFIKADLLIVDEAHTFGEFYMSNNTIAFTEREKEILKEYCMEYKTPTSQVLRLALSKGMGINSALLENVSKELESNSKRSPFEIREFIRKMELVFTQKAFDNYLECTNGDYIKTKFFSKFDLSVEDKNTDIVITSATLDHYTLKMFGCENKNQIYIQREDRNRYKGSHIISCYQEYRKGLGPILSSMFNAYNYNSGLILCTSNESVRWSINEIKTKYKDIKVFDNIKDFRLYNGHKVLVGSKKFYQGIDIPDLDFVILDKLPFSTYDDKFQAYSYFIEKVTRENAWTGYTMPLMFNSLLQGIGRLWRKNDIENSIYDQGSVVIFDERLEKKFNYIENQLVKMKPGIELIRIDSEGNKIEKIAEESKPKRTRKKIVKELTAEESNELIKESIDNENRGGN